VNIVPIRRTVTQLIKKHKTNDPFAIAREKNIQVCFEWLGSTLGYYNSYKRIQFIHINNSADELTQRFVCAHELGHAVLHPKANTPFLKSKTLFSVDKLEVEANKFAVELLLRDETLYEYQNTNLALQEIGEIHGIPRELAYLKKVK
jgi:Zn-dependent peptidase ImmA (M78 family)